MLLISKLFFQDNVYIVLFLYTRCHPPATLARYYFLATAYFNHFTHNLKKYILKPS